MRLDMFEFCTPQLQEQLLPVRARFKEVEEKKMVCGACSYWCVVDYQSPPHIGTEGPGHYRGEDNRKAANGSQ